MSAVFLVRLDICCRKFRIGACGSPWQDVLDERVELLTEEHFLQLLVLELTSAVLRVGVARVPPVGLGGVVRCLGHRLWHTTATGYTAQPETRSLNSYNNNNNNLFVHRVQKIRYKKMSHKSPSPTVLL